MSYLNQFDQLVLHATEKRWCWNFGCTTCGSMEFRNGMELIGERIDPLEDLGRLHREGLMFHDDFEQLSKRNLTLGCQVADANIEAYAEQCGSTYWLGFLGLALQRLFAPVPLTFNGSYLEDRRLENLDAIQKLISNAWSEKFFNLLLKRSREPNGIRSSSEAIRTCKEILMGERGKFAIQDLGDIEHALGRAA